MRVVSHKLGDSFNFKNKVNTSFGSILLKDSTFKGLPNDESTMELSTGMSSSNIMITQSARFHSNTWIDMWIEILPLNEWAYNFLYRPTLLLLTPTPTPTFIG